MALEYKREENQTTDSDSDSEINKEILLKPFSMKDYVRENLGQYHCECQKHCPCHSKGETCEFCDTRNILYISSNLVNGIHYEPVIWNLLFKIVSEKCMTSDFFDENHCVKKGQIIWEKKMTIFGRDEFVHDNERIIKEEFCLGFKRLYSVFRWSLDKETMEECSTAGDDWVDSLQPCPEGEYHIYIEE